MKERRETIDRRKFSEDCSQCDIMKLKMQVIDAEIKKHETWLSKTLTWKVFLLIMAAYIGIAGYNAVAIRSLTIDMATVKAQIQLMQHYVKQSIK